MQLGKWTWAEFHALPQTTVKTDIHCVTKWSKLDTVWQGVTFDDLLAAAAVKEPPAPYVMAHSDGGYTTNVPVADLVGGKGMIATRYDGAPISPAHGGPARLLVPHLLLLEERQWVRRLRFMEEDEQGFWESFGYHNHGLKLAAILALKDCGGELGGRIALALVPNEETGGEGGSAWLVAQGRLGHDGIGMLLAEPTSGVVWNANRGAVSLRVRVAGKSAHVGLQHRGENAFERMVRVVERLQDLKQEVEQRTTKFNIGAEQARQSILMLGGQSGGGANFNVVPEECWFTIDRRINPEENFDEEKARLIGMLESCRREGIPLEWEVLQEGRSSACREEEPLGAALTRSVRAITGEAPRFEMCPGLLEIRFYGARGVPAYAYGPGLLSVAHGPNEYVDLRKMIDCAAIYALTALEMLKS